MAPRINNSAETFCKKCVKEVKTFITCNNCNSTYHFSCVLKICGIFVDQDGSLVCCDDITSKLCQAELEIQSLRSRLINLNEVCFENSVSQIESLTEVDETVGLNNIRKTPLQNDEIKNNMEYQYLNIIIESKDKLIEELQDKIKILKNYNNVLEKIGENQGNFSGENSPSMVPSTRSPTDSHKSVQKSLLPSLVCGNVKNSDVSVHSAKQVNQEMNKDSSEISVSLSEDRIKTKNMKFGSSNESTSTNKQGNTAVKLRQMSKNVVNQQIQTNKPVVNSKTSKNKNNKWSIMGKATDSNIKAIPKKVSLFVSRINTQTTSSDFISMVKQNFEEAVCTQLQSKHPEYYHSYKVSINAENLEKAKSCDIWPSDAYVSMFFHRKTTRKEQT